MKVVKYKRLGLTFALLLTLSLAKAQVGEHRDRFSLGVNGGYVLSNVGFEPKVTQGFHGGFTGGLSMRYICEKYFSMICSIYGEINFASVGWKEDPLTKMDQPVVNPETGLVEQYSRTINYVQIPLLAHLAWGREDRGFNIFVNAGPQFGIYLSESTSKNYDVPFVDPDNGRSNPTIAQETMPVEKKFDYGIAVGLGAEYSHPRIGHFLLEGRYYFGLGDIYGNSKRDYFGKSNLGNIVVKATYLFDITGRSKGRGARSEEQVK